MPDDELLVEGPDFTRRVEFADKVVRDLEAGRWDFDRSPDAFAKRASADVFAKEIVVVFDGKRLTRLGRLVMAGTGKVFNLMGPIHPQAIFRDSNDDLLQEIYAQTGSRGLRDFEEFERAGRIQRVEWFNHTHFFQLRDLVFWSVLHGSGCSPSTLEHMARHFASGMVVHNSMYAPGFSAAAKGQPVFMQAACMSVSFPTTVLEWMDKPLFGGLFTDTIHAEYLLTPEPMDIDHPYLPLVDEGAIEYHGQRYSLRKFAGITPKNGVRGPGIPPEGETEFGAGRGWLPVNANAAG
jgi:hypothetical protein